MNCPICNKELQPTDAFCPTCGYEIHIYPSESKAMAEYEEMRAERYRKTWEALNESQAVSQRLEAENSKIQHKLDEKEQELKDKVAQNEKMDDQLKTLEKERNRLRSQIEEKLADISERKGTIQKLKGQISDYLEQRAQLKKEKEEWKTKSEEWEAKYKSLFADISEAQHEISQLQLQLKSVTEEKERLEDALSKKNIRQTNNTNSTNSHTSRPQNRGERMGEVIFKDDKNQEFRQDIFLGENVYSTPNNMISGYKVDLFKITMGTTRACVLKDLCRGVRDHHNSEIKKNGKQIFNNEIFFINSIKVQVIIYKKR